ncbi:MAG: ABC transporter substrate-binding protein [Lachnospiraceae bacterium]|jgi:iron complex transport system substrate-binding protein|nr:ABC transporter substrate-binding protein [Lachnospiraceae bacterium]
MKKDLTAIALILFSVCVLTACQGSQKKKDLRDNKDISPQLTWEESMELTYATEFQVDRYEGGYALLTIFQDGQYLVVPEGKDPPRDLDKEITVLQQPIENMYLVASAVMDMFVSLDALDRVGFSGLQADSWYIDEAREAMEKGQILHAGSYAAPDYEQLVSKGCRLAVENTMIYHTPEVKERLEKLEIPVLVDHSSYESNPLGRTEWVKLYGVLAGEEARAEEVFQGETKAFNTVDQGKKTGSTVAFFYITTNGEVNVRRSSDYLPKMIEMAGGSYVFDHLGDEEDTMASNVTMQMEEFYAAARDADYIIYNSTTTDELASVEDLLEKSSLLERFRAVREGNVYCTTKNLYQSSMELGTIISDMHKMLMGEEGMTYLYQLE